MLASERETVVTTADEDKVVRIWTAQRRHINKLRRHKSFTEVGTGFHDGSEWAEFTIPADQWNPVTGAKRKGRVLTEQERSVLADRLATARASKVAA